MEPSTKKWFCSKTDLFHQAGLKSENGNQLGSIYHVNIKEPKTPGTTWNHLKKYNFVPKMIYFTKWVKNLKWEPARFHITC